MRRIGRQRSETLFDQAFVPVVVYSQPPTLNIGEDPAAGSVSVPVKVLVAVIVPRSSIADALPLDAVRMRSVNPSLRRTNPLIGRTSVVGGFCQLLVLALTVPSARTFRFAVISCPSASDPPEHGSVAVFRTVNDQLPAAWACVIAPPPVPPMPMSGSVLFSQATDRSNNVRQMTIGRTWSLQNVLLDCVFDGKVQFVCR
ncbi:MAG TPA: hypothetical protein VEK37_02680 [Gemmatimonadaceae bacterium]|nr:hypothetical protein [Gemmatimonadaceae bacterium]